MKIKPGPAAGRSCRLFCQDHGLAAFLMKRVGVKDKSSIWRWLASASVILLAPALVSAAEAPKPISYQKDVLPILTASCIGCHSPEKKKGGLDMSSFGALAKGGKEGVVFVASQPEKSKMIAMVSGPEPDMPEKGDKLTTAQVEILKRWVAEGAKDDSPVAVIKEGPAGEPGPTPPSVAPKYASVPVDTESR